MAPLLVNVLNVTNLASGASITLPHGLNYGGSGVIPTQVLCDRASPIAVTASTTSTVTFTNGGTAAASANFRAEYDHSIHAVGATPLNWQGATDVGTIGTLVYRTAAVQSITAAANTITPTTTLHRITNTTGGNIALTSTPQINWPSAVVGQLLIIENVRTSNAHVSLARGAAQGLALSNASKTLQEGGSISFIFDGTYWIEQTHTVGTTL
jgi:hypothetical protein